MKANINGQEYIVKFHHYIDGESRITECEIKSGDVVTSHGSSFCSGSDNFDRAVGRKLSLARALHGMTQIRALRREFWNEYFKQHKR